MESMMQFAIAALVAHLIEKLKRSPAATWINDHSDAITKCVAAAVAFLSAIGITYTWDPTTRSATFSNLPVTWEHWQQIATHAFTQYWVQKGYYLAAIKPNLPPAREIPSAR